jgi:calcineurin-like phosphoesterase family protein
METKEGQFWFTSDFHIGHTNIIKYCSRPFKTVSEMDKKILTTCADLIKPEDTLYFLGDISMNPAFVERALSAMGSKIVFIFGNHDKKRTRKVVETHKNVKWSGDYKEIEIRGQKITLCHYAMRVWNQSHRDSWQLYGHSHGSLPPMQRQLDVGIDNSFQLLGEYRPFRFSEIQEIIKHLTGETKSEN